MEVITINDRIKQVRLHPEVNLSQEAFGKALGVTGAAISRIENGTRKASEQIILGICREFNVNQKWLRTGEGDMFVQRSREEELAAFAGDLLASEQDDIRRRFVFALSQLKTEELEMLEKIALHLAAGLSVSTQEEKLKSSRQNRMETAGEIAQDLSALVCEPETFPPDELFPEETEELKRFRQEIIAKRARTGPPSAFPNANLG